jgi:hypothetical protein
MKCLLAVLSSLLFAAQSALAATPISYEYQLGPTGLQGYAISANGTWSPLQFSPSVLAEAQNFAALLTTGKFLFALRAVAGGSDPGVTETSTIYTYSIEGKGSLKLLYTTPIPDSEGLYEGDNPDYLLAVSADGTILYNAFQANEEGPPIPSFASWNIQPSGKLEVRDNLLTKAPTGLRSTPGRAEDYVVVGARGGSAATPIAYDYNVYDNVHTGNSELGGYAITANGTWSKLKGSPFVEAESQGLTAVLTTGKFLFGLGAVNGGSDPGVTQTSTIYTYSIEGTGSLKLLYTTPIPDSDRSYGGSSPNYVLAVSADGKVLYAAFYANVNGPDYPSFASWNIEPSGKLEVRDNLLTKAPTGLRSTPGTDYGYVIVAP